MPSEQHAPIPPPGHLLEKEGFAFIVLGFTLVLTAIFWQYSSHYFSARGQDHFLYRVEKEKIALLARMQAYEQVLRGGSALFASSDTVTHADWRSYVEQLDLDLTLPGIQGTGFALMLEPEDVARHEAALRADGYSDYAIRPPGERQIYSTILYLEPLNEMNRRAIGYDMYSDPVRREAMERARDTGQPAMSGRVTLVQEIDRDVQPGFLIYLPVYRSGMALRTIEQRREALLGFVYSPFRAHDLMRGAFRDLDEDAELELYDTSVAPENLLFRTANTDRVARHSVETELEIGGRTWVIRFFSRPAFEQITASIQPWVILVGGTLLNVLLFLVMFVNARHRRRMRTATRKLEQSRDRYLTLVDNVPGTVFRSEVHAPWRFFHVSQGIEALSGHEAEAFLGGTMTLGELIHPDEVTHRKNVIDEALRLRTPYELEYRVRHRNRGIRWVSERGRGGTERHGQARWLDGVIIDITERKLAENAIRDLAFYDPLTSLPNRRLLLDRLGHAVSHSDRTARKGAVLFIDLDNFKTLNDTQGHEAGDILLCEVGLRLRETVREDDTVARLGGDEFVVMLEDLGETEAEAADKAVQIGIKILATLNTPYRIGKRQHQCTPSIGVTTFCGSGRSAERLIRDADTAMYHAKATGRNRVCLFGVDDEIQTCHSG